MHISKIVVGTLMAMIFIPRVEAQYFSIHGNLSTWATPVRFASITVFEGSDTANRYSTTSDSNGNYHINVPTFIGNQQVAPSNLKLAQNYPNPFNTSTHIAYTLKHQSTGRIRILNILGQQVRKYELGDQYSGLHEIVWDGTNDAGFKVSPGLYFYQLIASSKSEVKKMLYLGSAGGSMRIPYSADSPLRNIINTRDRIQNVSSVFKIVIQNTDSTQPRINTLQIDNLSIHNDTLLNIHLVSASDLSLCYSHHGDIYLNNINGTHRVNISNSTTADNYCVWSPDGRYIAFQNLASGFNQPSLLVYDLAQNSTSILNADGSGASSTPCWVPNGKIYFSYAIPASGELATYMMNPDGSDKNKILNANAGIFFYNDSYTFLYYYDSESHNKLYKTTIDNSYTEYICDLNDSLQQYVPIQGFNPVNEELLITYYDYAKDSLERVAIFNIRTKEIRDLLSAENGYVFWQVRYSRDYSKIAIVEYSSADQYLSIYEHGTKKRIVHIPYSSPQVLFSYQPLSFSPDGKYVAFDESVFDAQLNFTEYLYVVDIDSGSLKFIDTGVSVSWGKNPGY